MKKRSLPYAHKAEDYAAYRAPYAADAIGALVERVGLRSSWIVADIGAGTGNVARHFVDRSRRVYAVEPDIAMLRQAERQLGDRPSFAGIVATAEHIPLTDRSVDLITIGQALHWFDVPAAERELARVLVPEGWIALVRNRFGEDSDPEQDAVSLLSRAPVTRLNFPARLEATWKQHMGAARSTAGTPCAGDAEYAAFEREHRRQFDDRAVDGVITVSYSTELTIFANKAAHQSQIPTGPTEGT